jgi:hypothetical protein
MEFETYLKSIGIDGPFLERTTTVFDFVEKIYKDELKDIFVSEYIDSENNRQFESLWIFSEHKIFEARNFLNEDDLDCTSLPTEIQYWRMKKAEFDFDNPLPKSRLSLDITLINKYSCSFKASQSNCIKLKQIFNDYLSKLQ